MDFTPEQKYSLLSKMGYTGSVDNPEMDAFIQSNPAVAARMGKFDRALKRGFQAGGYLTSNISDIVQNAVGISGGIFTETSDYANQKEVAVAPDLETAQQNFNKAQKQFIETQRRLEEDPENESLISQQEELAKKVQRSQQDIGLYQSQQMQQAPSAPELVTKATESPEDLIQKAEVAQVDPSGGEISPDVGQTEKVQADIQTVQETAQAQMPEVKPAAKMGATQATPQVQQATSQLEAAQKQVSPEAQVQAQQQTESAVSQLEAAQGSAILMDNPVTREIQQGELVSGSAVDAAKVQQLNESIQAATATPSDKATVQGQLEGLMQDFEGGDTPAWAAGAIRQANAAMAQRGLGASSMAGQAVLQATMEAALPIAQADAQTRAQFEAQNLSNRQQTAMFAAEQRARFLGLEFDQEFQARVQNAARVADVANMNFTAEQQIALENSRVANTVNLENLRNDQAMVMAEASALANLEITNLNNRQQAAVQNAQNFLQMDMANLNNDQQTAMFKSQQNINAMLSDQAAENAAEQFNAASENQVNQFFADLQSNISRFNADQKNAIEQFNAGEENATSRFNSQLEAAREQFNAQNSLVIEQANAKWRQDVSTRNTAAQNEANLEAARTANVMTQNAMNEVLQRERDIMSFAFQSGESAKDREMNMLLADKRDDLAKWQAEQEEEAAKGYLTTRMIADIGFGGSGGGGLVEEGLKAITNIG